MNYSIQPILNEDREAIMDIFNQYVENSFAAYPEEKLPYQAFDMFLEMSRGYPFASIKDNSGIVVGFGMLRAHNPLSTFSQTAEVTYFVHSDQTGNGLGKMILNYLEENGRHNGITNLLANISSLNPGSIRFHQQNGFVECGHFRKVGSKNNYDFDTVWMQKRL